MKTTLILVAVLSVFSSTLATNFPPKDARSNYRPNYGTNYGPSYSRQIINRPLAIDEEPLILNHQRPLLIRKTIQEINTIRAPAPAIVRAPIRIIDAHAAPLSTGGNYHGVHGPLVDVRPAPAIFVAPSYSRPRLITEPLYLDHGHSSLYHSAPTIILRERPHLDVLPAAPSAYHLPERAIAYERAPIYGGLAHAVTGGAYNYPLLLKERPSYETIVAAPIAEPLKHGKGVKGY